MKDSSDTNHRWVPQMVDLAGEQRIGGEYSTNSVDESLEKENRDETPT